MLRNVKKTLHDRLVNQRFREYSACFLTTDESFIEYYADRLDLRPFDEFAGIESEIDEERYVQLQSILLYVSPRYVKHIKFLITLNLN